MKNIYLYIVILSLTFVSCNNFLDIEPKGLRIPRAIEDYDYLLAPVVKLELEDELFLSADDFVSNDKDLGDLSDKENKKKLLYTYSPRRFDNPSTPILAWNNRYKAIYIFNKVISEIDKAESSTGYSESDKKRIKAEAQYGRAAQYLFLVNMFAKHYDKANAASEEGVPLVLIADTSQESPKKSSVQQVYDLIIKDLTEAIENLPEMRKELNRPSKGSGLSLLSRAYLYMGNYELALTNARLALQQNETLSDYTTSNGTLQSMAGLYETEQYSRYYFGWVSGHYYGRVGQEASDLFNQDNDMRYTAMFGCSWAQDDQGQWYQDCSVKKMGFPFKPNPLPSIGEMYATIAECYARDGKSQEALENINKLRKHRIKNVEDKAVADFSSPQELLSFILDERRRELLMSGTRLFDLKRLNLEPNFKKTVTHTVEGVAYKAEPNSGVLVLPIPMQVKKLNTNL